MDLDRLYEFSVFAERGSVRAAARELGLAPATLSARLHVFEDSLNARLVAQEGNALRLTQEGRILLAHAGGLLQSYRTLTASMAAFTRHPYRRLRIALAETSLPVYLGPFLDRMNQTWPDVRIDLLHGGSLTLVQSLLGGAVDLYFTLAMDAAAPEGLAKLTLDWNGKPIPRLYHAGDIGQPTKMLIAALQGALALGDIAGEACAQLESH